MSNIITEKNYQNFEIGAKAARLFKMRDFGINVPELICISDICTEEELLAAVNAELPPCKSFAVRSSASVEDSKSCSFAGQFETYLDISSENLYSSYQKCLKGTENENIRRYALENSVNPREIRLSVIIQRMLTPELSGVIFTANPQGILNETVVAVGRGTGNNVVEDKVAVTQYYFNTTDKLYYYETQDNSPLLSEAMLTRIFDVSNQITALFGDNQDIEFAICDNELYITQSRPITSLEMDAEKIILDNSNISESYPGISLPMTISFVNEVYSLVFKSCVRRLTKNDGTVERLNDVLSRMTDSANGRIYYRISGWYDVIQLLPFSSRIIPIWQDMLGVSDKRVSSSAQSAGLLTKLKVTLSFFQLITTNQKKMNNLIKFFEHKFNEFEKRAKSSSSPQELLQLYNEVSETLGSKWDLTLVNDMYSFIYTGLLKNSLKKKSPDNFEELTNSCISGNSTIESMKPPKLLAKIRSTLENERLIEEFGKISDKNTFDEFVSNGSNSSKLLSEYITLYGDRCPGELKLETSTFRTNPELIVNAVQKANSALNMEITQSQSVNLKGINRLFAKNAASGIILRERSRMARGQIFGLVRGIILKIGNYLVRNNRIEAISDVFFLTLAELRSAVYNDTLNLKELIAVRKLQYKVYEKLPAYTRIIFNGAVSDKSHINVNSRNIAENTDLFRGTPCSSGVVEGEVLLIENAASDISAKGKIIVTRQTDPGWVFLITQSIGIISERGSLLSHTAIISRELKKPAVVGAPNVFELLNNGDFVRLNGVTGEIKILSRKGD